MKFNRLVPELAVESIEKSLEFYVQILGFKVEYARPENKFAFVSLQGSQLMLEERNGSWETGSLEFPFGRGINFQIEVDDVEDILRRLDKASVRLMKAPWESWYRQDAIELGQREFLVQDPDGYLLRFCEDLGTRPVTPLLPA